MLDASKIWENVNKEYSELTFSTKDDFNIGFYQKGNNQLPLLSSGKEDNKTSCYLGSMEDLRKIKEIVNKGLNLLGKK